MTTGARASLQERCDDGRDLTGKPFHSACYAPFGTFELDPRGFVFPCCMNNPYPLGNITEQRLLDIWRGPRAAALRQAVRDYDFGYGCGICRWQVEHGKGEPTLRQYDRLPIDDADWTWPTEIGFALSNVCNLECVHCNGEYSSRIRARIEHRPPLPAVYGDEFFEDLRVFLPHLVTARFVGGEPFMMRENYRVWELLIADGLRPHCYVTTNGTQYNDKVEAVLAGLPVSIVYSMDSPHKERFEAIRRNADFDRVVANLDKFQAYTREAGTDLVINHCLMRDNWHEFADMLRFAEERGIPVNTSTVFNEPFSLYKAPIEELREVVATMEAATDEVVADLPLNGDVWKAEVAQLRNALDEREAGVADTILVYVDRGEGGLAPTAAESTAIRATAAPPRRLLLRSRHQRRAREELVAELAAWAGDQVVVLEADAGGVVRSIDTLESPSFYGLDDAYAVGRPLDDCLDALRDRLGPAVIVMDRHVAADRFEATFGYANEPPYEKSGTFVRLVAVPAGDDGWTVVIGSDEIFPPVSLPDERSTEPFSVARVSPLAADPASS